MVDALDDDAKVAGESDLVQEHPGGGHYFGAAPRCHTPMVGTQRPARGYRQVLAARRL